MRRLLRHVGLVASLAMASAVSAQLRVEPVTADNPKTDLDKIGDTMENVATKPLKDLNIIQAKVDPYIGKLMDEPYSMAGIKTCAQHKAAIGRITEILGPDVDSPENRKEDKSAAEQALSLGESAAGSIIPFSGVIRRLSGAQAKQDYAKAAVLAGSLRRAYIKGSARANGCKV